MFTAPTTLIAPGPAPAPSGYLPSSELWYPPESPSIYDDEFEGDMSAWSSTSGFSDTVAPDLLASFTTGDTRYDINSMRPSWLIAQPPSGGSCQIYKYFSGGLPDGTWWFRFQAYYRKDASIVNSDHSMMMFLGADTVGAPNFDEYAGLWGGEPDASKLTNQAQIVNGGTATFQECSDYDQYGMFQGYGAIIKDGTTYHYFLGGDSGAWKHIDTFTYTGGETITCLGFSFLNASTQAPGNSLLMLDFIRYLSHGDIPG